MKHVLKVLNAYIESNIKQIKYMDERIKELNADNFQLQNEVDKLREDLKKLSKENLKK